MRIIAGQAKRRNLVSPEGQETRPMTSRVREAVFSALSSRLAGARVLDLYAGSGSLGLEALSRGASSAVFVENSPAALKALRSNVEAIALGGDIRPTAVERYLAGRTEVFDIAFVDPPWALSLASVTEVMAQLEPRVTDGGIVVLRRRAGGPRCPVPKGLVLTHERRYGDDEIFRYRKVGP